jgi:hypothetical protein
MPVSESIGLSCWNKTTFKFKGKHEDADGKPVTDLAGGLQRHDLNLQAIERSRTYPQPKRVKKIVEKPRGFSMDTASRERKSKGKINIVGVIDYIMQMQTASYPERSPEALEMIKYCDSDLNKEGIKYTIAKSKVVFKLG